MASKNTTTDTVLTTDKAETPNPIIHDAFDALQYESFKDQSTAFQKLVTKTTEGEVEGKKVKTQKLDASADRVLAGAYHSFYKLDPQLNPEADRTEASIMKNLHALPEFKDLRASTRLDDVAAALATVKVGPQITAELARQREEQEKRRKERGEQDGEGQGDGDGDGQGEGQGDGDGELLNRQAIRNALKEAADDVEKVQDAMGLLAGTAAGERQHMPIGDRLELARTVLKNPLLQQIAQLFGRFKNVVQSAVATSPSHGNDEIVEVSIGSDLPRMLPTELIKLKRSPKLFYKDLVEGALQVYSMKGEEKMGAGPIIVALDVSPSMGSGEPHTKEAWAKAFVIALAHLAKVQKRRFSFIAFNTRVVTCKVYDGAPTSADIMDIAEHGLSGGTSFEAPLMKALQVLKKEPALRPADIVLVTDGYAPFPSEAEFMKEKKALNFRVHSVGLSTQYEPVSMEVLGRISDTVNEITGTGDVKGVSGMIGKVASLFRN
jgi:uncharacterized protein with von Willebrand factor type A (vWA) domain